MDKTKANINTMNQLWLQEQQIYLLIHQARHSSTIILSIVNSIANAKAFVKFLGIQLSEKMTSLSGSNQRQSKGN
jgi:hypothetical protein